VIAVFHGSDSLKAGRLPTGDIENPVYVALSRAFAGQFGETVHEFRINESLILDLRNPEHQKLAESEAPIALDPLTGLPHAYGEFHFTTGDSAKSLQQLKSLAVKLGFKGIFMVEADWPGTPVSIEIYDTAILIQV
jgi:hypothetical protein